MKKTLLELNKKMQDAHEVYLKALDEMLEAEKDYNNIMSKLVFTDTVRELPNQAQRDAQIQEYLLNHNEYRPIYERHLQAQHEYKKVISYKMLLQEQSRNLRALIHAED